MQINTKLKASINVRCGKSGTGKSYHLKLSNKNAARLVIFDPDNEYSDGLIKNIVTVYKAKDLVGILQKNPKGALKVRYVANGKEAFNLWAKAAFAWGNCVALVDELGGVTGASKAVDGWHTLVSRGRKRGITIFAGMQRPAECDKTVLGNATSICTGQLTRAQDRKYLAVELDIDPKFINNLRGLEYIRRTMSDDFCIQNTVGRRFKDKKIALTQ